MFSISLMSNSGSTENWKNTIFCILLVCQECIIFEKNLTSPEPVPVMINHTPLLSGPGQYGGEDCTLLIIILLPPILLDIAQKGDALNST